MKFKTKLKRTMLPPKLTLLLPQEFNQFLNCSYNSFQVTTLLELSPT